MTTPSIYMSRIETQRYLSVSRTTLFRWRNNGTLLAEKRDRYGHLVYLRRTVVAFHARRHGKGATGHSSRIGERAARAYEMFDQGARDKDVVVALCMKPERVSQLRINHAEDYMVFLPLLNEQLVRAFKRMGITVSSPEEVITMLNRIIDDNLMLASRLGATLTQDGGQNDAA